jgi:endonuclease/exonuclease/phosphatase family metal-dependent hydrolase
MVPFGPRVDALAADLALAGADVVAVQELFLLRLGPIVLEGAWSRFAARMAAAGLTHQTDPRASLPRWFGQSSGLALFSRWPLDEAEAVQFSQSRERLNNKGILFASLRLPAAAPLCLADVHLDKANSRTKAQQVQQLGQALGSRLGRVLASPKSEQTQQLGQALTSRRHEAPAARDAAPARGKTEGEQLLQPSRQALVSSGLDEPAMPRDASVVARGEAEGSEAPRAQTLLLCGDFNIDARSQREWAELVRALTGAPHRPAGSIATTVAASEARGAVTAINGWGDPQEAPWPPTHGVRTVDHIWLAGTSPTLGQPTGVHFARRCQAITCVNASSAGPALAASDHRAVLAVVKLWPTERPSDR